MSGSGVVDEDTARAINSGRATLGALLRTVQKKLQKVFIFFVVGMLGGIVAMRSVVWPTLKRDLLARGADVIAQTPFDVILLQVKIGLIAGVILTIPPLLYYAREPLRERGVLGETVRVSKWKAAVLFLLSAFLFVGGILYAYLVFFPVMFDFLAGNALGAGFAPFYSIVHWTQFIMVLGFSFGLAAQLPLTMTALSYTGIVPYETFRDKWKYAVVLIFTFGALFSPPDPFTQLMWAAPLLVLYGFSLYLAKVVTLTKRGSEQLDLGAAVRERWNHLAGVALLAGAGAYVLAYSDVGRTVNDGVIPRLQEYGVPVGPLPTLGDLFGLPTEMAVLVFAGVVAAVAVVAAVVYLVFGAVEEAERAAAATGTPEGIDLADLDAFGVRAAPAEVFERLTEPQALEAAQRAIDANDPDKAEAILDRFDMAHGGGAGDLTDEDARLLDALRGKERREEADRAGAVTSRWNVLLGVGAVVAAAVYGFFRYGGPTYVERRVLPALPAAYRPVGVPDPSTVLGLPDPTATVVVAAAAGLVALVAAAAHYAFHAGPTVRTVVDLSDVNETTVRTADPAVFGRLTEDDAVRAARAAKDAGDPAVARAVLDRYDDAQARAEAAEAEAEAEEDDVVTRTTAGVLNAFTEEETTEDDIGGYYHDIAFIFDSLRSRAFRIVATFMLVLAGTFAFLYQGGIGYIRCDFLSRLPSEVTAANCAPSAGLWAYLTGEVNASLPQAGAGNATGAGLGNATGTAAANATNVSAAGGVTMNIVTLHPVEALVFEVKISTLLALVAVAPMLLYYAWPALVERGLVTGNRRVVGAWGGTLFAAVAAGSVLGYTVVAPNIISYLVYDTVREGFVINYRVSNFFWLVFLTTVGIGLFATIPASMVLFNRAGVVSYRSMRRRWRVFTVGAFVFAGLITPDSVYTMFIIAGPMVVFYAVGLVLVWLFTLGGRRDKGRRGQPA